MSAKCIHTIMRTRVDIMIDTSKEAGSSLLPDSLTQLTKIAGL